MTTDPKKPPNTAQYEPIPDVAVPKTNGTTHTKNDYDGLMLDTSQIELLSNLDDTIHQNASFQFALPTVPSEDMILTQGQSMLQSMIVPTITTIVATLTAFGLSALQQLTTASTNIDHTITTISILIFPYINAMIQFLTTFQPIQTRCMESVEPIFPKIQLIPETIQTSVTDISTNVHTNIDTIEHNIQNVMTPILPTLQMATQYERMLRTVQPNLNIPDASDIDTEIQETRTIVTQPLQDAVTEITMSNTTSLIPYPWQSSTKFYWSIVIPIAVVCLSTQLGTVYYTTTTTTTTRASTTTRMSNGPVWSSSSMTANVTSQQLRGSWKYDDVTTRTSTTHPFVVTSSIVSSSLDHNVPIHNQNKHNYNNNNVPVNDFTSNIAPIDGQDVTKPLWNSVSNTTTTTNEIITAKDEILNETNVVRNEINSTMSEMKEQLQNQLQNMEHDIHDFEENIDTEVSNAIGPAKAMIQSVMLSYMISLLQMGLVYLLTSPKVKAYIMNFILQRASRHVDVTLRRTGVPQAMDEIFNVRLVRIRTKLLQLFTSVQEINGYLEQLGLKSASSSNNNIGDGDSNNSSRNPVAALADTAKSFTSRFGFGK